MLPILTLPTVLGDSGLNHTLVSAAFIGVAAFVVYMGLGVVLLETDRPLRALGRAAQWIWNKVRRPHPPLAGLETRMLQQRNEIRAALGREWRQIFLLVVGRLGLDYLCLLAALRVTGSQPRIWLVLLAYSAAGIIALFPVTPGGLGIVEASLRASSYSPASTGAARWWPRWPTGWRSTGSRRSPAPSPTGCSAGATGPPRGRAILMLTSVTSAPRPVFDRRMRISWLGLACGLAARVSIPAPWD